MPDKAKSAAQIQAELDQMRRQLVDSVDELATRVDPRRIAARAVDSVKGTAGHVKDRLAATATSLKSTLNPDDEENWAFDAADVPEPAQPATATQPYPLGVVAAVSAAVAAGVAWLIVARLRKRR